MWSKPYMSKIFLRTSSWYALILESASISCAQRLSMILTAPLPKMSRLKMSLRDADQIPHGDQDEQVLHAGTGAQRIARHVVRAHAVENLFQASEETALLLFGHRVRTLSLRKAGVALTPRAGETLRCRRTRARAAHGVSTSRCAARHTATPGANTAAE